MSDIIPFPLSEKKLKEDIRKAELTQDLDRMYELFEQYESQFELDEALAIKKCDMLYQMRAFLELREEAIILLKQGLNKYDELMIYYIKSLNGLEQYYESVEVINQIIDEVRDHKTRMELFPLKEYAQSKLDSNHEQLTQSLAQFHQLNAREQTHVLLQLIDNGHYDFKETIHYLLSHSTFENNIVSLMIEYLRFAQSESIVTVTKYGTTVNIIPKELSGLEHTTLKSIILPKVIEDLEDGAIHIVDEANHIMNNHSILLYPLNIESLFPIEDWIVAYDVYFKSMLGIDDNVVNQDVLSYIYQLDKQ
ncbi:hypothetical protein [Staphylococcus warneri]|uniref:hypothetical protein n=1 Tax=Staphylococcus warneri TaxID=1292 RepID=UPI0001A5C8BC|nr:hypothetical protein [Staphylococcus warneri]EEQ79269.1 hypothetical protein STAWA0001_0700 [Staphylococcus warneri L37603]MCJ1803958.1 hypothetical protein [Staphylococcus warneri]QKI06854.1 hypothetical protein FOC62_03940 [Staphylococcus warneri]